MDNQDWFSKGIGNMLKYGFLLFFAPVLVVLFGWLGGYFIQWVFGDMITNSLNILIGTSRFTKGQTPDICAALALIGGYFHYKFDNKSSDAKKEIKSEIKE